MDRRCFVAALSSLVLLSTSAAEALPIPNARCLSAKAKAVAKAYSCGLKAATRQGLRGKPIEYATCTEKLAATFEKAESRETCAAYGDTAEAQAVVEATVENMLAALDLGSAGEEDHACIRAKSRIMAKYGTCRERAMTAVLGDGEPLRLVPGSSDCEWNAYEAHDRVSWRGLCPVLDNIYDLIAIPWPSAGYLPGIDLAGYDFTDGDLRGDVLRNADLSGIDLEDGWLALADVTGANLSGARFIDGSMYGAVAVGADLSGIDATGAELWYANLTGANLTNASLTNANVTFAVLTGAEVAGADFNGADFDGADLSGVPLSAFDPAGFSAANLAGCPASLPVPWECRSNTLVGPNAPLIYKDLSGANFDNVNADGAQFDSSDLNGATLVGASLVGADFSYADLTDVDFGSADLTNATFIAAQMTNANLAGAGVGGASFQSAHLVDVVLPAASFSGNDLSWAEISGSTLVGIDLGTSPLLYLRAYDLTQCPTALPVSFACERGAIVGPMVQLSRLDLSGGNFAGLDLHGANFTQSDLTGADFAGTDLTGAYFSAYSTGFTEVSNANMAGATLVGADIGGSSFFGVDFTGANLQNADAHGTDFRQADLTGADVSGAMLTVTWWSNTICPDGTNSDANGNSCCGHHVGGAPFSCSKKVGT